MKLLTFLIHITLVDSAVASLVDISVSAPIRIRLQKYPVETYRILTDDGYILSLFRIPHSTKCQCNLQGPRPVVFLMHGFMMSADVWILSGPSNGLAFNLADAGFDVFMGNARGNRYGKKHAWIPQSSPTFWHFSWTEIALFDLRAMLLYVLRLTKARGFHYVGHMEGSTCILVLLSERPRFNRFVISIQMMAPVAFMNNAKSPIMKIMGPYVSERSLLAEMIGKTQFRLSDPMVEALSTIICPKGSPLQEWCVNPLFLILGFNPHNLNTRLQPIIEERHLIPEHQFDFRTKHSTIGQKLLPDINATNPTGGSVREFIHYLQLYNSGEFKHYDHGIFVNLLKYGRLRPPKFDLSKVVTPVKMIFCDNDFMNSPIDVFRLAGQLPNVVNMTRIKDEQFSDVDFLFATKVRSIIYDGLIEFLFERERVYLDLEQ